MAAPPGAVGPGDRDSVVVEEIDGIHIVRGATEPPPDPMSVAELGYAMAAQAETVHTVVVGTESEQVWAGLGEVLGGLGAEDDADVLLVMSHAANRRGGGPSAARRIAERWGVRVTAPDGTALLVPGGSLFVPREPRAVPGGAGSVADGAESRAGGAADGPSGSGWWRFTPGRYEPEPVGRQLPAPSWQTDADRLCAGPVGESAAYRIPAGVLCRPKGMPPPRPDDLSFAVPVSQTRMVVLVGAPGDEAEMSSRDVVDLLASLSPEVRSAVLLAPGRNIDLLPAGQAAADAFGIEVEVLTGAPVMTDGPVSGGGGHRVSTVLIGGGGAPAWQPFVEAVACRPAVDGRVAPPRLIRWQPPVPGLGTARAGVVRLSDQWQVAAVRSGLRITRTSDTPYALPERQVDPDEPAIELGLPGQPLGRPVLSLLDRLLAALAPEMRERAVLYVYGECGADQMRELSRMMAAHGIRRLRTRAPVPAGRRVVPTAMGTPGADGLAVPRDGGLVPPRADGPAVPRDGGLVPPRADGPAVPRGTAPAVRREGGPAVRREGGPAREAEPASRPRRGDSRVSPALPPTPPPSSQAAAAPAIVPDPPERAAPPTPSRATGQGPVSVPRSEPADDPAAPARPVLRPGAAHSPTPPAVPAPTPTRGAVRPYGPGVLGSEVFGSGVLGSGVSRSPASGNDASGSGVSGSGASGPRASASGVRGSGTPGSGASGPSPRGAGAAAPPGPPTSSAPPRPPSSSAPPAAPTSSAPPRPPSSTAPGGTPRHPGTVTGPESPAGDADLGQRRGPIAPGPGHRATEAERAAFLALVPARIRSAHDSVVGRLLDSLSVPGSDEPAPDPTDLLALRLYLAEAESPPHARRLAAALHNRDPRLLPYAACVASGLNHLPRHRGVVLRAGSAPVPAESVTGRVLRALLPVSSLPVARAGGISSARYAIWSEYGRRVGPLLPRTADPAGHRDEVVFGPGSAFRVLGVHGVHGTGVILLREVPVGTPSAAGLDERDRAVASALTGALDPLVGAPEEDSPTDTQEPDARWPSRCRVPVVWR
ncbi:hypothetical protein ACIPRD_08080 [Streptomyces sp. NPDC090108]|uniref:hypothetical protein n=1 Tax=Streptomyces sp. NPDC090108 TaxID=3365947 RepID=UPI0037FB7C72